MTDHPSLSERRERIEQIVLRTQECGMGDGYDKNKIWRRIFCDDESLSLMDGRSDDCRCRKTADAILSEVQEVDQK